MEQESSKENQPKARILIIEDERPLILLVRRTLSKLNFEVVGEVTVDAGLRRLDRRGRDGRRSRPDHESLAATRLGVSSL